jgi:transcriptional antiterminator RfaH
MERAGSQSDGWYLIYTKPRQERLARENLERQGYPAYLPLVAARRRREGRIVTVTEALFPRYLFVRLSPEWDDWRPIRSTLGVTALVSFGNIPARVPDALMEMLRAREDARGLQDLPRPEFNPGDRVRVVEGAFAGYEGVLRGRSGQDRVAVLLDIIGQANRVQVPLRLVEPAT